MGEQTRDAGRSLAELLGAQGLRPLDDGRGAEVGVRSRLHQLVEDAVGLAGAPGSHAPPGADELALGVRAQIVGENRRIGMIDDALEQSHQARGKKLHAVGIEEIRAVGEGGDAALVLFDDGEAQIEVGDTRESPELGEGKRPPQNGTTHV